jgi:GNAT superfamily N-acetyltransferase
VSHVVAVVTEEDVPDVVPLMQAYCAFYGRSPDPQELEALALALVADPVGEGTQLVARDLRGRAIGFATVYWSWETTRPGRLGVMNDLYVTEHARGSGVADTLIGACADAARARGCRSLSWVTAPDNARAQRVYERTGAERSEWVEFALDLTAG